MITHFKTKTSWPLST